VPQKTGEATTHNFSQIEVHFAHPAIVKPWMTSLRLVTEGGGEGDLEGLLRRFKNELSELTAARVLHQAKAIYEELHPETRHGGERIRRLEEAQAEGGQVFTDQQKRRMKKQAAKMATWPAFVRYAAEQTDISERTIYRRLEAVEVLGKLDAEAEQLLVGTKLTNNLTYLVRIARIPKGELHRDLVNVFTASGPKKMKAELAKWEEVFDLVPHTTKAAASPKEPAPALTDEPEPPQLGDLAAFNERIAANHLAEHPKSTIPMKVDARVALERNGTGYQGTVCLRGRHYMIRVSDTLREITFMSQERMKAITLELNGRGSPTSPPTPPEPTTT
jgi:hypothetical protein